MKMYDLLEEFENYIVGEVIIPITHYTGRSSREHRLTGRLKRVYSKAAGADADAPSFWTDHSELAADQCGKYSSSSKENPG